MSRRTNKCRRCGRRHQLPNHTAYPSMANICDLCVDGITGATPDSATQSMRGRYARDPAYRPFKEVTE